MSEIAQNNKPQIVLKRIYKHPIYKVWQAVSTAEGLGSWLMEVKGFHPVIGNEFTLNTKSYGKFDGIVNCKILDIQDPSLFSHTWSSNVLPETVVTYKLKALSENETLLTFTHNGFSGFSGWVTRMILGAGWKRKLLKQKLQNYLDA